MGYFSTIELQKESMTFAAGHTTIFSATEREPLHGHQYGVFLGLTTWVEENGMTFDYRYYKDLMTQLCGYLHQTFLMPQYSPHLTYTEDAQYHYFTFNGKTMPFLKEDVTILPVTNITIEELSRWLLHELLKDEDALVRHRLHKIVVKVSSSTRQFASHTWEKPA